MSTYSNYIQWVCLTLNAYVHQSKLYSMSVFNFSLLYTSIDSHEESKGPIFNYIQWVCLTLNAYVHLFKLYSMSVFNS